MKERKDGERIKGRKGEYKFRNVSNGTVIRVKEGSKIEEDDKKGINVKVDITWANWGH